MSSLIWLSSGHKNGPVGNGGVKRGEATRMSNLTRLSFWTLDTQASNSLEDFGSSGEARKKEKR